MVPIQSGGGQERGIRSGTVPTPLAVGLGAACELAEREMDVSTRMMMMIRDVKRSSNIQTSKNKYLNSSSCLTLRNSTYRYRLV